MTKKQVLASVAVGFVAFGAITLTALFLPELFVGMFVFAGISTIGINPWLLAAFAGLVPSICLGSLTAVFISFYNLVVSAQKPINPSLVETLQQKSNADFVESASQASSTRQDDVVVPITQVGGSQLSINVHSNSLSDETTQPGIIQTPAPSTPFRPINPSQVTPGLSTPMAAVPRHGTPEVSLLRKQASAILNVKLFSRGNTLGQGMQQPTLSTPLRNDTSAAPLLSKKKSAMPKNNQLLHANTLVAVSNVNEKIKKMKLDPKNEYGGKQTDDLSTMRRELDAALSDMEACFLAINPKELPVLKESKLDQHSNEILGKAIANLETLARFLSPNSQINTIDDQSFISAMDKISRRMASYLTIFNEQVVRFASFQSGRSDTVKRLFKLNAPELEVTIGLLNALMNRASECTKLLTKALVTRFPSAFDTLGTVTVTDLARPSRNASTFTGPSPSGKVGGARFFGSTPDVKSSHLAIDCSPIPHSAERFPCAISSSSFSAAAVQSTSDDSSEINSSDVGLNTVSIVRGLYEYSESIPDIIQSSENPGFLSSNDFGSGLLIISKLFSDLKSLLDNVDNISDEEYTSIAELMRMYRMFVLLLMQRVKRNIATEPHEDHAEIMGNICSLATGVRCCDELAKEVWVLSYSNGLLTKLEGVNTSLTGLHKLNTTFAELQKVSAQLEKSSGANADVVMPTDGINDIVEVINEVLVGLDKLEEFRSSLPNNVAIDILKASLLLAQTFRSLGYKEESNINTLIADVMHQAKCLVTLQQVNAEDDVSDDDSDQYDSEVCDIEAAGDSTSEDENESSIMEFM